MINDKAPSYRNICISILKNDLRALGYEGKKSDYYSIYKRIEIDNRKYEGKQLKLF